MIPYSLICQNKIDYSIFYFHIFSLQHQYVYMDVSIDGEAAGRLVIEVLNITLMCRMKIV